VEEKRIFSALANSKKKKKKKKKVSGRIKIWNLKSSLGKEAVGLTIKGSNFKRC